MLLSGVRAKREAVNPCCQNTSSNSVYLLGDESTIGGYSALVGICEIRGGTQKNERGPKKCEPTL